MVKIRVSYQEQQELRKVLKALGPMAVSYRISKTTGGPYKKAYINIKEPSRPCN